MSALRGSVVLTPRVVITPCIQGDPNSALGSIDFGDSSYDYSLSVITKDPAEFDRLAEAAQAAAQMLRDRISQAPAPAASSPASQAVTGTVAEHTAAAPVARDDRLACLKFLPHAPHQWVEWNAPFADRVILCPGVPTGGAS